MRADSSAGGCTISSETYKSAGVDIEAGAELVDRIGPMARATTRAGVTGGLGGFGAVFDLKAAGFKDPVLVSSTDGVGTKLKIAIAMGIHDTVGIDLVAMCVNDLVVQGAEPLFFLDYFATGRLDPAHGESVVSGIAEGCRRAGCGLIGGETAEMPGMYANDDYDLAGFAVGAAERGHLLPDEHIAPGDIIIGLESDGVHSNGFSLVRRIAEKQGLEWGTPAPFRHGTSLGEALLTPTRIYVKPCLTAIKHGGVKGLAHITGGGLYENIPRALPTGTGAALDGGSWPVDALFHWLAEGGNVTPDEMARTFNCGIGMVLVAAADEAQSLCALMNEQGERAHIIGKVTDKPGVTISDWDAQWA